MRISPPPAFSYFFSVYFKFSLFSCANIEVSRVRRVMSLMLGF